MLPHRRHRAQLRACGFLPKSLRPYKSVPDITRASFLPKPILHTAHISDNFHQRKRSDAGFGKTIPIDKIFNLTPTTLENVAANAERAPENNAKVKSEIPKAMSPYRFEKDDEGMEQVYHISPWQLRDAQTSLSFYSHEPENPNARALLSEAVKTYNVPRFAARKPVKNSFVKLGLAPFSHKYLQAKYGNQFDDDWSIAADQLGRARQEAIDEAMEYDGHFFEPTEELNHLQARYFQVLMEDVVFVCVDMSEAWEYRKAFTKIILADKENAEMPFLKKSPFRSRTWSV